MKFMIDLLIVSFSMRTLFLPTFQLGEVLAELLAVLVGGEVLAGVLVELVDELDAEVYHLLHGTVLREVAVGEAVLAVVGIVAADLVGEGHAAPGLRWRTA